MVDDGGKGGFSFVGCESCSDDLGMAMVVTDDENAARIVVTIDTVGAVDVDDFTVLGVDLPHSGILVKDDGHLL